MLTVQKKSIALITVTFVVSIVLCMNIYNAVQLHSVILSIIQYFFVFIVIVTSGFKSGLLSFIILYMLSVNSISDEGINFIGDISFAKLKIFGPIALSQVVLVIFLILTFAYKRNLLFSKAVLKIWLLGLIFCFIGLISGLMESISSAHFSWTSLRYYTVYFVMMSIFPIVLLQLVEMKNSIVWVKAVFYSSCIAPSIMYYLGFYDMYSIKTIPVVIAATYLFPFFCFLKPKQTAEKVLLVISFVCYLFIFVQGGMGGKGFLFLMIFCMFLYLDATIKFKLLVSFCVFASIPFINNPSLLYGIDSIKLLVYKLENIILLAKFLLQSENWFLIPNSPLIRLYEIQIALEYMLSDIKYFIFGLGFGGMFQDFNGYFSGLDLSSAFPEAEILSNHYSRAHDTFSVIPMVYGMSGVVLIFLLMYNSHKITTKYPAAKAYFPIFGLVFMYNYAFLLVFFILAMLMRKDEFQ